MNATSYENAMNHWKNGYLAWNPTKYQYYRKNFYIGLSVSDFNPKLPNETSKASAFYHDTDHELEDRSIMYKDRGVYNTPEYNYVIKISSKEYLDNFTESDYNEMLMDFEQKVKYCKVMNRIDELSKDFE
jgi:hypothetical protein